MKKIALISKILVALLVAGNSAGAAAAAENYHTVQTGDTIYGISKRHGIKHNSIMTANKLSDSTIYPGQKLVLPPAQETGLYYIRPGDNLFRIARKYGLEVNDLMTANNLGTTRIRTGDRLLIPARSGKAFRLGSGSRPGGTQARPVFGKTAITKYYKAEEIALLARLIHAEARGEGYQGKVAVGAVIMNRMASGKFPDNIREVIYQRNKGVYQFTPVKDGNIRREPGTEAFRAAEDALQGIDPTGGALFFYNPEKSSDRWIRTLPVTTKIGNHVFAK